MLKHILLIEDDKLLSDNIAELLIINDFLVTTCPDGGEAIELINNNDTYDLIVCDISLPSYSGLEILDFVKNKIYHLQVPFIFLSAKAEASDIRNGMNLGADDYLTKPFSIKELLHLINSRLHKKAISEKRLFDELQQKLDDFPKILSHVINTPINGVLGLSSLMLSDYDSFSKEDIKKSLSAIVFSCERLLNTKEKLFLFFDLMKKHNQYNNKSMLIKDLIVILKFYVQLFNKKENNKPNRISLSIGEHLKIADKAVKISNAGFTKVIEELLDNSLKHSVIGSGIELNIDIIDQKLELSIKNIASNLSTTDFNLHKNFMDEKKSLNGNQGFCLGILFIEKICTLNEADFYFLISEHMITFYVKFKIE